jgi:hypothetical protein
VRSGSPQANEMVRWTISSDERRELGRAAAAPSSDQAVGETLDALARLLQRLIGCRVRNTKE